MDKKLSNRIGIMGGTFDPIHYGHLLIAQSAAEEFDLDRVVFLPTGKSPHKAASQVTKPDIRCAMVRIATENNPMFSVSTLEADNTEINYTCLTLQKLEKMYRAILPFLIPLILTLLLVTYVPGIVTWLPNVLLGAGA